MKKILPYRVSILLGFMLFQAGAWALVIDDFNGGGQSLAANAGTPFVQGVADSAGVVGGEREATVFYDPIHSTASDDVRMRIDFFNQNNFSHSQDAGVAGLTVLVYDGNDGDPSSIDFTGLGGLDLTANNADAFIFDVIFADQSVANVLDLRVYTSATEFSDLFKSFPGPINSLQQLTFSFADFVLGTTATGMADFTNVNAILLAIDGRFEPALDVRLDSLSTNEHPPVPEPASVALMGIGLAMTGFLRRRIKK